MEFASRPRMVARCFQELDAWRLANELKQRVYEILDTSSARRDGKFCDQIQASASSAPANIAEGFGYYEHPQFAKHVRIAIASLDETTNHLGDGLDRRFWTADQIEPVVELTRRSRGACVGLLKYLTRSKAPSRWPKP
jgi:four helix bundle protein